MYKVVLVGDGETGKTSLVRYLRAEPHAREYVPTLGLEVHPVKVRTNRGDIVLHVWDCAGQERYGGLREGYYCGAKAAIVVREQGASATEWLDRVRNAVEDYIPMLVVTGKADLLEERAGMCISAKTGAGVNLLVLELVRQLTGDRELQLLEEQFWTQGEVAE